jgi:hypothetical protein
MLMKTIFNYELKLYRIFYKTRQCVNYKLNELSEAVPCRVCAQLSFATYIIQCTLALVLCIWLLSGVKAQAQNNVGIGTTTPNSKAVLELQAIDKGFLAPRLTTAQMNSISTPPNGLLVYNTTVNCFYYYNAITISWKSMCNFSAGPHDTLVLNLVQIDSLLSHYIKTDSVLSKTIITQYLKADSAYIKYLVSQYIKTDSIKASFGRFDSIYINGQNLTQYISSQLSNTFTNKDTVVIKYLRTDSIYSVFIKADSAFIKSIFTNTITSHYITTDSIYAHKARFDSLYIGGKNISAIITDSIAAQAWLLKGNNALANNKLGTLNAQNLNIVTNGANRISIMSGTGNVGIGQTLPSEKLDIIGNIKNTGSVEFGKELKPAGVAGNNGEVLTSKGLGTAPVWTPITTLINNISNTNINVVTIDSSTTNFANINILTADTSILNYANINNVVIDSSITNYANINNLQTDSANFNYLTVGGQSITSIIADSIKATAWLLKGNASTIAGTNFIGTTDYVDVVFKRDNVQSGLLNKNLANTSFGVSALNPSTTGTDNTAIGLNALNVNTTGNYNTAIGSGAQLSNTTGNYNIANGYNALTSNTSGKANVAVGYNSLLKNTTGGGNVAIGTRSLEENTTSSFSTAVGTLSLALNTTGTENTAVGYATLRQSITGSKNTAVGQWALNNNVADKNTSIGQMSLMVNTSGVANTALGTEAGRTNTTGSNNTFIGANADGNPSLTNATAIGFSAFVGASNSMVLGGTGINAVKVGIGTVTPAQTLDVVGNLQFSKALMPNAIAGTSGQILTSAGAGVAPTWINANTLPTPANAWNILGNTGTTSGANFIGTTDVQDLVFKVNSTEKMRIAMPKGFVGIGTPTPLTPLHVIDGARFTSTLNNPIQLEGATHTFMEYYPIGFGAGRKAWHGFGQAGALDFNFRNETTSGGIRFTTASNLLEMYLSDNGNVGIGTNLPAFTLDVIAPSPILRIGTIGQTGGSLFFGNFNHGLVRGTGAANLAFTPAGNDVTLFTTTASLHLATGGLNSSTARLTVDVGGNVGIGTIAPIQKLHVEGDILAKEGQLTSRRDNTVGILGVLNLSGKNSAASHPNISTWTLYNMKDYGGTDGLAFWEYYDGNNDGMPCGGSPGDICGGHFIIQSTTGNVGIGTQTPTNKLEVIGSVKIVDGTQGAGKVLTSDGTGKATWQTPTSSLSNVIINSPVNAAMLGYVPSSTNNAFTSAPAVYTFGWGLVCNRIDTFSYGGHSYALYAGTGAIGLDWFNAYYASKSMGGYLATFPTFTEWNAVNTRLNANIIFDNTQSWIGFVRAGYRGPERMSWITGEEGAFIYPTSGAFVQQYQNFMSGEPNNISGTEGYVFASFKSELSNPGYAPQTSHGWYDRNGNTLIFGFIVEWNQ